MYIYILGVHEHLPKFKHTTVFVMIRHGYYIWKEKHPWSNLVSLWANEWMKTKRTKLAIITIMDNVFTAQASKNLSDKHTFIQKYILHWKQHPGHRVISHFPFSIIWHLWYLTLQETMSCSKLLKRHVYLTGQFISNFCELKVSNMLLQILQIKTIIYLS